MKVTIWVLTINEVDDDKWGMFALPCDYAFYTKAEAMKDCKGLKASQYELKKRIFEGSTQYVAESLIQLGMDCAGGHPNG